MRRVGLTLAVLSIAAAARAEEPLVQASLTYTLGAGTETCPTEQTVREQVAVRMGHDPFRTGAAQRVMVTLDRHGGRFHARITTEDGGRDPAVRDLASDGSCAELAQSVVLAMILAVDAFGFGSARATANPLVVPPSPDEAAHSAAPSPAPSHSSPDALPRLPRRETPPQRLELSAGVRIGLGILPSASLGPVVTLRVGRSKVRGLLEAGADLPLGKASDPRGGPGSVTASLLRAGGGACLVPGVLFACGRVDLGAIQGRGGGLPNLDEATTFYAAVAVAAGVDAEIGGGVRAIVRAEAAAPMTHTTLRLESFPVWRSPAVAGSLAVAVGYEF